MSDELDIDYRDPPTFSVSMSIVEESRRTGIAEDWNGSREHYGSLLSNVVSCAAGGDTHAREILASAVWNLGDSDEQDTTDHWDAEWMKVVCAASEFIRKWRARGDAEDASKNDNAPN